MGKQKVMGKTQKKSSGFILVLAALALGLVLVGCEGDDGADGAAGPAGPAGAVGAVGAAGPAGAAGTDGPAGAAGAAGAAGPAGATGATGTAGAAGATGAPAPGTAIVMGSVVKGPLVSGTLAVQGIAATGTTPAGCQAASVANLCTLGSGTTDTVGAFSMNIPSTFTGPVVITATAGSFTDFVSGLPVTLTTTNFLRAILPKAPASTVTQSGLSLNALTTLAAARALEAGGNLPNAATVTAANNRVAELYGLRNADNTLIDIVNTEALDVGGTGISTASDAQKLISVINEAFSSVSSTSGATNVIALIQAIANDFGDGVLDGKNGLTQIVIPVPAGTATKNLSAATSGSELTAGIVAIQADANSNTGEACDTACQTTVSAAPSASANILTLALNGITVDDAVVGAETLSVNTIANGVAKMRHTATQWVHNSVLIDIPHASFSGAGTSTVNETFTLCVYDGSNTTAVTPGCSLTDKRSFSATLKNVTITNAGPSAAVLVDLSSATVGFSGVQANGTVIPAIATDLGVATIFSIVSGTTGTVRFSPNALLTQVIANGGVSVLGDLNLVPTGLTETFKFTLGISGNMKLDPGTTAQVITSAEPPVITTAGTGVTVTCIATKTTCTDVSSIEGTFTLKNP